MFLTPNKINTYLMLRLPAAFLCGVRVDQANKNEVKVAVRTRWINRNPFGSMYFAVQSMAAELSTGVLVMDSIRDSGVPISMLVTGLRAEYLKKAVGRIEFICGEGQAVSDAMSKVLAGEPQTLELTSIARDTSGETVSVHKITWSLKARSR